MKKLVLCCLLLIVAMFLPDITWNLSIKRLESKIEQFSLPEAEYRYCGTQENRVRALEAFQSQSPMIRCKQVEIENEVEDIWNMLYAGGLLPVNCMDSPANARKFTLSLQVIPAQYDYCQIEYSNDIQKLKIIRDETSNRLLEIIFSCQPEILTAWLQDNGEGFNTRYRNDDLLQAYGEILELGKISNNYDECIICETIQRYEVCIRDTSFRISLTLSPEQGLIIFRLGTSSQTQL